MNTVLRSVCGTGSLVIRYPSLTYTYESTYNMLSRYNTTLRIERLAVDYSVDCDTGLYTMHDAKVA